MTDVQRVRFVKAIAENALKNMECEIMQDDLKLVIEHLNFLGAGYTETHGK